MQNIPQVIYLFLNLSLLVCHRCHDLSDTALHLLHLHPHSTSHDHNSNAGTIWCRIQSRHGHSCGHLAVCPHVCGFHREYFNQSFSHILYCNNTLLISGTSHHVLPQDENNSLVLLGRHNFVHHPCGNKCRLSISTKNIHSTLRPHSKLIN